MACTVANNSVALFNLIPPTLAKLNGKGTKYRTHLNSITPSFDFTIGIPVDLIVSTALPPTYIHDEVIEDLHYSTRASDFNAAGSFWLKCSAPWTVSLRYLRVFRGKESSISLGNFLPSVVNLALQLGLPG